MSYRSTSLGALACLMAFASCAGAEPAKRKSDYVYFESAVYLLAAPKSPLADQMKSVQGGDFKDVETLEIGKDVLQVGVRANVAPLEKYAPPDDASLKHFGRGLSPEQSKKLQTPHAAWVLDFIAPVKNARYAVRRAAELMSKLARGNDGVVWDEETREVFSVEQWDSTRVEGWEGNVPDVSRHITIHFYEPEGRELPRAITLGMSKFGQPDIVMNEVPRDSSRGCGNLINLVCQTLVEKGGTAQAGVMRLDVSRLAHKTVRERTLKSLVSGALGMGQVGLAESKPLAGDPRNRLMEITFDGLEGTTALQREQSLLATVFGVVDRISVAKAHDEELEAARKRAMEQLAEKKKIYAARLPLGEVLLVKAPFKAEANGVEWMWVEILAWKDQEISGILQNQPDHVPELKAGARVTVKQGELFDYLLRHADGTTEGNETGKILQRREEGK